MHIFLAGPTTTNNTTNTSSPDATTQIAGKPLQQLYRGVNPYKSAPMAEPKSSSSPASSVSSAEQILRQIKQHRQQQQEQDLHDFAQSLVDELQPVAISQQQVPLNRSQIGQVMGGSGNRGSDGRTKYLQHTAQQQLQYQQQVAQQQQQQQVTQSKNDKNSKARNNRRLGRHESRYTSGNYTKQIVLLLFSLLCSKLPQLAS